MIEASKLKWMNTIPHIDDVHNQIVLKFTNGSNLPSLIYATGALTYGKLCEELERYAIIETSEEPLPLDGVMPKVHGSSEDSKAQCVWRSANIGIYVTGSTDEEAISNWNAMMRRIK